MDYAAKRRSQRILLDIPLIVRGEQLDQTLFHEETFTVTVNAHGALVMLAARIRLGQELVLVNPETSEERQARVAYIGPDRAGLCQVGVEFPRPSPEFWPVAAPPADWHAQPLHR